MRVSSWVLLNGCCGSCSACFGGHNSVFRDADIGQSPVVTTGESENRWTSRSLQQRQRGQLSLHSSSTRTAMVNGQQSVPSPPRINPTTVVGDGSADRMFTAARSLHLRRHRSNASRENALRLFRKAMQLRPDWKQTDSRFSVESGIDLVFKSFSCQYDTTTMPDSRTGASNTIGHDDARCVRATLVRIGYNARRIQRRFGVSDEQRLPGPYYLHKSLDHKHVSIVASMGRPKDDLDVAIRIFLLGLALPRVEVERALGHDFLKAVDRLGMLGECPVDPSLLVSHVQLFPLDAEALLPPPETAAEKAEAIEAEAPLPSPSLSTAPSVGGCRGLHSSVGSSSRCCSGSGGGDGGTSRSKITNINSSGSDRDYGSRSSSVGRVAPPMTTLSQRQPHRPAGYETAVREENQLREGVGESRSSAPAGTTGVSSTPRGVVAASDMVFATDWPPPGSTALTEEPVMYIGPDSIGLVQHVPSSSCGRARGSPGKATVDMPPGDGENQGGQSLGSQRAVRKGGENKQKQEEEQQQPRALEEILDLCSGSGVQGIAAAVLRRGDASVTCVDVNPRAVRFSRFNALLNGLDLDGGGEETAGRFRAVVGDLYGALDSATGKHVPSAGAIGEPSRAETDVGDGSGIVGTSSSGTRQPGPSAGSDGNGGVGASSSIIAAGGGSMDSTGSANSPTRSTTLYFPSCPSHPRYYDLILANPPFVPVPPRLGAVRRRYDVFASGGADGEEVIEGLFRGAFERLRPGGGLLAVVTELANPRTFDAKLRRWIGGQAAAAARGERREGGRGEAGVRIAEAEEEEEAEEAEDMVPVPLQGESRGGLTAIIRRGSCRSPEHRRGNGSNVDGDGHHGGGGSVDAGASRGWLGLVLHGRCPWTSSEYADRRAGSPGEVEGWERHLGEVGIEEMAAGFVFVRRDDGGRRGRTGASEGSETEEGCFAVANEGDGPEATGQEEEGEGRGVASRCGVGRSVDDCAVEIQGVEKLWAPHNRAAVENTRTALRRM